MYNNYKAVIMKVNAKVIKRRLDERKSDRMKVTLYLSKSLYSEFKKKCKPHAASAVIEEIMKGFIA